MIKRIFDIICSLLALALFSPLMLLVAMLVVIDSRGGALFVQQRVGKRGVPFGIYKFRTMVSGAESKGPLLAVRGDSRVTRVGKFLRRWSLDELPQLFNILKGEMSLVGPRPEIPQMVTIYSSWQRKVLNALPGLTGFSQVLGRDDIEMETKLRLDSYYIKHQSFCLDLWIIARTAATVVSGKGAF
jgi:lipopolysaccharide/colanic/teichoic acid biosynthesis glycosyltransferase